MTKNVPNYWTPEDGLYDENLEPCAVESFNSYKNEVGGTAYNGEPIPEWDRVPARVRRGWRRACETAIRTRIRQVGAALEDVVGAKAVVDLMKDPNDRVEMKKLVGE